MKNDPYSHFSFTPSGIAIVGKNRKIVFINEKFKKTFTGLESYQILNHTIRDVIGTQFWKKTQKSFIATLKGESPSKFPLFNVFLKSGVVLWNLSIQYFPIPSEKGFLVGVAVRDVSDEVFVEKSLTRYKERLDQAQKAGGIGVFEWDIKLNKVWWSDEEEALFGVPPGHFKGTIDDWISSVYKPDKNKVKTEINKSIRELKDMDLEFRVLYPGSVIHWLKVKSHIYKDGHKPDRMIGVHHDITLRKQNEELLAFKAESSRLLSSSLDYKKTLAKVASTAVTFIADWCAVDMINEETGEVELLAAAHKSSAKSRWAKQIRKKYPVNMDENTGLPHTLKTGESVFVPFISQEEILKNAKNDEQRDIILKLGGISSLMIVPISNGNKTQGAITFVSSESKRQYTKQDLELAQQLASRAALAIENAKLYETVSIEQKRRDALLENVPAVVWESWGDPTRQTQKITYVSSFAEKLLGYPRTDWLTIPNFWKKIIYEEDQDNAVKIAKKNYDTKDRGVSRFRWVTSKGNAIWVESQSFIVKDNKGKPIGMRGIVHDINDSMEEVSRKDEFLSIASHELKTPITTIKAYSQLLEKTPLSRIQKEYLSKSQMQTEKLIRLISDLLDVSRFNAGKLTLNKTQVNVDSFLGETIENLQTIIKSHTIYFSGKTKATVNADRDRLSQVITNLILNAVKYSPKSNKINVVASKKDNIIYISVEDFGVGIANKHQNKIFDRFYRIHNTGRNAGLGIGLYISKTILNKHNGELNVVSTEGKGSTFTITLPTI